MTSYVLMRAAPVFASQMGYVVTLAGIAWGIVIFGEQHSLWFWGALVLMMLGLTLVQPRKDEDELVEADGEQSADKTICLF